MVRHGRTAWNAEGRFQGHGNPPLDATGVAQADLVARSLVPVEAAPAADHPLHQFPPFAVVSSDLCRARQSAAALVGRLGMRLSCHPELREVDVGAWTGLRGAEAAGRFPDEWTAWTAGADVRRGGAETIAEAAGRVARMIVRLLVPCPPGRSLVVVSHGIALQGALGLLRAQGVVHFAGAPPHLANGEWRILPVAATTSHETTLNLAPRAR